MTKSPTVPAIDLNSIRSLVAANYLGSIGALTIVILPGIVGVIADSLQLGPAQVGMVITRLIAGIGEGMSIAYLLEIPPDGIFDSLILLNNNSS